MQSIDLLDKEIDIVRKGYSLVYQYEKQTSDINAPKLHSAAGKNLSC